MKVLIVIMYYLGLTIFALIVLSVSFQIWPERRFTEALASYFLCEMTGVGACDKSIVNRAIATQIFFDATTVSLVLYPAINIIYALDIQQLKKLLK